jgi:phosphohistidine phosphatase
VQATRRGLEDNPRVAEIRHLYLLRHAKSSWDQPGQSDHERPLADRGQQAVKLLARYAEQHRINPDLILCSTARRTRETLEGVLPGRTAVIEPELYVAGHDQLLQRLHYVEADIGSVMLVGHNPALQMLILSLAASESPGRPPGAEGLDDIRRKLPTGALVTLSFDSPWSELARGRAELVDYIRPKALLNDKQS